MSTGVTYTKNGTRIQCDTSVLPRPRPKMTWPIPVFSGTALSLLSMTLVAVAQTDRRGVQIESTPATLPGTSAASWTLFWMAYQGSAPASPTWNAVPVQWPAVSLLLDNVMPAASVVAYLQRVEAGQTYNYAQIQLTTPDDPSQTQNALAVSDQITLITDWESALAIQTTLDAQALALGIVTSPTVLDTAMTALSAGLIAAGAPSAWLTTWGLSTSTPFYATGIVANLSTWWAAIANAQTALSNAIATASTANVGLIPNYNSAQGAISGIGGAYVFDTTGQTYTGHLGARYVRSTATMPTTTLFGLSNLWGAPISNKISCSQGQLFNLDYWQLPLTEHSVYKDNSGADTTQSVELFFFDINGNHLDFGTVAQTSGVMYPQVIVLYDLAPGIWQHQSLQITAPANTAYALAYLCGPPASVTGFTDSVYWVSAIDLENTSVAASTTISGAVKVDGTTIKMSTAGVISASGSTSGGSVTTVSVATANGFSGSVATATTTPVITIACSVASGMVKSNGTGLVAAVAGTDYVIPSAVPVVTTSSPLVDSTAAVGASGKWADGAHVHPTDTSRQAAYANLATIGALANAAGALVNNGSGGFSYSAIPVVGTATPLMNGTAAIGASGKWADGAHVHPSDTSRQPLAAILTALAALPNAVGALTNNGSGSLSYSSGTATTGRLIGIQYITASGAYLKGTNNPSFIVAEGVGGGGGGGGNSTTNQVEGGNGGPGGFFRKTIPSASLLTSETITIGAGGTGGAGGTSQGSNGTTGGTSSFGSHCSATGGYGGNGAMRGLTNSGVSGIGVGGDLNIPGQPYGSQLGPSNTGCDPTTGIGYSAIANSGGAAGAGMYGANEGYASGGTGGSGRITIYEYS